MNEYVHDATDQEVLGLIVECTGAEKDNAATKYTLSTFNMLRKLADCDATDAPEPELSVSESVSKPASPVQALPQLTPYPQASAAKGINLSYTINLNLPATKDIEVFNAIFKSLKEHLLED